MLQDCVEKEERPLWTNVSGKGYRVKSYLSSFQRQYIHNGCLCRILHEGLKPNRYQILVTRDLRVTVLQHCHALAVGGHYGVRKTLRKVRQKYLWSGLYTYVEQYVKR